MYFTGCCEKTNLLYKKTMKRIQEIKSWILGMGKNVKAIEPKFL